MASVAFAAHVPEFLHFVVVVLQLVLLVLEVLLPVLVLLVLEVPLRVLVLLVLEVLLPVLVLLVLEVLVLVLVLLPIHELLLVLLRIHELARVHLEELAIRQEFREVQVRLRTISSGNSSRSWLESTETGPCPRPGTPKRAW